jgi:hypothetical protein
MSSKARPDLTIRTAAAEDGTACGQICYDAFSTISAAHGFPCDLPGPEATIGLLSMMFSTPGFYAIVTECDGRIVGSNVLAEQMSVRGYLQRQFPAVADSTSSDLQVEELLSLLNGQIR